MPLSGNKPLFSLRKKANKNLNQNFLKKLLISKSSKRPFLFNTTLVPQNSHSRLSPSDRVYIALSPDSALALVFL